MRGSCNVTLIDAVNDDNVASTYFQAKVLGYPYGRYLGGTGKSLGDMVAEPRT